MKQDSEARKFYSEQLKPNGTPLDSELVNEYSCKATLFTSLKEGLECQIAANVTANRRIKKGDWYAEKLQWYAREAQLLGIRPYSNVRSFESAFKAYLKDGYSSLLHKGIGNDKARVVTRDLQNLLISLWRMNDKPFVRVVHDYILNCSW